MNLCGRCGICCKLFSIPGFKEANTWCKCFEKGKGCTSYDNRPEVCVKYECFWLGMAKKHIAEGNTGLPEHILRCRPDRLRMIVQVTEERNALVGSESTKHLLVVQELAPGAMNTPMAKTMLEGLHRFQPLGTKLVIRRFESDTCDVRILF